MHGELSLSVLRETVTCFAVCLLFPLLSLGSEDERPCRCPRSVSLFCSAEGSPGRAILAARGDREALSVGGRGGREVQE